MKRMDESINNNDIPVIFISDSAGKIVEKISINEWRRRKKAAREIESFEIKLYREALNYYSNQELEKAEDLLLFLSERTRYSRYEYIERLANIYRQQKRIDKERCILLLARREIIDRDDLDGTIQRIDIRMRNLDRLLTAQLHLQNYKFNQ